MRSFRLYTTLIALVFFSSVSAAETIAVDSLMRLVMKYAEGYSGIVRQYEADVYLKTNVETEKKNILYKFTKEIPNFVIHDLHDDRGLIESISKLKFKAPNSFSQDIQYVTGTLTKKRDIALLPFRFVSMDIYAESAHGELFYLPLRKKSASYYQYYLEKTEVTEGKKLYKINFQPNFNHPQLIRGFFVVEEGSWRVTEMHGEGTDFFVDFKFDVIMGDGSLTQYLPVRFDVFQSYSYLGNLVHNINTTYITYNKVNLQVGRILGDKYNLGNRFKMRLDSVPLNNDPDLWKEMRAVELSEEEKYLMELHEFKDIVKKHKILDQADSVKVSDGNNRIKLMKSVVANSNYRFKSGDIRFSGLLNPNMLGFTTQDGVSYRQRFSVNFDLPRQQRINTTLFGGYIFGRKQLNYGIRSRWNYEPDKMGYLVLSAGRGNPSLSSKVLEMYADSLDFVKDRYLRYYKDHYFKIFNNIELTNGLQLGTGIDYHIREANKVRNESGTPSDTGLFPIQYNFVPLLSLSWTPAQYYVYDRNQKVYFRSDYPSFKLEYAQSLKGVMGSKSSYSKVEFDINQQIDFGLMSSLNYHAGFGFFMNQQNEYFNDFTYFAKSYFPDTWGDRIGGGFIVLPRRYYNASSSYAQMHLMYETSKFGLTQVDLLSRFLLRERLYLSQLYTPYMKSYTEMGYGLGNRYANAAVFVGFHKLKFDNIGARAVFLL